MGNGPRYTVKTRHGWFSLDEGSYRDYLSGKLTWIDWPPLNTEKQTPSPEDNLPVDISPEAIMIKERADKIGVLTCIAESEPNGTMPHSLYKDRFESINISELALTVRSSNGLMRAGITNYAKLNSLICENGLLSIRNLGVKSQKEIRDAFICDCYSRLLPYEKAEFWQNTIIASSKDNCSQF